MSVYQQGLRLFRLTSTRLICLAISILCRRCPPHVNVNTNGKPFSHEITVNKWQDYTVISLHTLLAHETTPAIGCTQLFLTITYANLSCLLITLFWASQSHLSYNLSPWTPLRCVRVHVHVDTRPFWLCFWCSKWWKTGAKTKTGPRPRSGMVSSHLPHMEREGMYLVIYGLTLQSVIIASASR